MEHLTRRALLILLLSLALIGVAAPAKADSAGYRWASSHICVENRTTGTRYDAVRDIVNAANAYTNLAIWHKNYGGCSSFAQRIYVTQRWSSSWWWSQTSFTNAYYCATSLGPRTVCLGSPAHITFNTRHALSSSSAHWAAAHELGAALGLAEISWTCNTVMRVHHSSCASHPHALSWWDRVGTTAHPGINLIYRW